MVSIPPANANATWCYCDVVQRHYSQLKDELVKLQRPAVDGVAESLIAAASGAAYGSVVTVNADGLSTNAAESVADCAVPSSDDDEMQLDEIQQHDDDDDDASSSGCLLPAPSDDASLVAAAAAAAASACSTAVNDTPGDCNSLLTDDDDDDGGGSSPAVT